MTFNIQRKIGTEGKEFEVVCGDHGLPLTFNDGKAAAETAKALTIATGVTHRPQRAEFDWRKREADRFLDGTYTPLPWVKGFSFYYPIKDHFAHVSKKEPGTVAFTASNADGLADKQTTMKPGRYLEKFFSDRLYSSDIENLAKDYSLKFSHYEIKWAKTADEIERIYSAGPDSCMTHEYMRRNGKVWQSQFHPARVYEGDFYVAYLENDGGVTARALVRHEKMTYSRVYGDVTRLDTLLKKAGYFPEAPLGAKIKRHMIKGVGFVAPYIDAGHASGTGALGLEDKKDHLRIVQRNATILANTTTGIAGGEYLRNLPAECSCCGKEHPSRMMVYSYGDRNRRRPYCDTCREENLFICSYDGNYHDKNDGMVTMHDGAIWARTNFDGAGFTCPVTGGKYSTGLKVTVWSDSELAQHPREMSEDGARQTGAFYCEYFSAWFTPDQKVVMNTGEIMSLARYNRTKEILHEKLMYAVTIGNKPVPTPKGIKAKMMTRRAEVFGYKWIISPETKVAQKKKRRTDKQKALELAERNRIIEIAKRKRKSQKERSDPSALAYTARRKKARALEKKKKADLDKAMRLAASGSSSPLSVSSTSTTLSVARFTPTSSSYYRDEGF
jgi:hypothetical protein